MDRTGSGKKKRPSQDSEDSSQESRRSRRSLAMSQDSSQENSEKSQTNWDNSEPEANGSGPTPEFVLRKEQTMENFTDQDIFSDGREDSEKTGRASDMLDSVAKVPESELGSQTQDMSTKKVPESPMKSSQSTTKPLVNGLFSQTDEISSDDDLPLKVLAEIDAEVQEALNSSQETLSKAEKLSQESGGFELTKEDKTEAVDLDLHDESDDEPLAMKTSTPVIKRMSLTRTARRASKSPRNKTKHALKSQSPVNKLLRSTIGHRGKKYLNRSVDSAKNTPGKRRKRRVRGTQDDTDLARQPQEKVLETTGGNVEEQMMNGDIDEQEVMDNGLIDELNAVENIKAEESEERSSPFQESEAMLRLNKGKKPEKFVSPLRSPPRRGKVFSTPETPPSHKKHPLLSRASLILQRAKVAKPVPTVPQRGRGPIASTNSSERPGAEPAGILKSPINQSPSRPGIVAKIQRSPPTGVSNFRPIHLPRIYSPSASPSAGILRKRKLSGDDFPADSPSPPNKQRRVCFNDTIETREIPSAQKRVKARMVGRGSPRPVNRCLDLPQNSTQLPPSPLVGGIRSSKDDKFGTKSKGRVLEMKDKPSEGDSELSEPQASLHVTPDTQLDSTHPICPEFTSSELPVALILPQLTSSVWSAGLGGLIRSKNIKTVGDLAALTEQEVNNLPIKTPKVSTVRDAIKLLVSSRANSREKHDEESPMTDKQLSKMLDLSPSKDESPLTEKQLLKLSDLSPSKDPNVSIESTEVCDPDVETRDLLDDIRNLDNSLKSTPPSSPELECAPELRLSQEMSSLESRCSVEQLKKLPSAQLMQIFTQLNSVIGNVVVALKEKCPTSPNP